MKKKVSELSGAELDYWAAKAEGIHVDLHRNISGQALSCEITLKPLTVFNSEGKTLSPDNFTRKLLWMPHADWSQGGPIIEKHKIAIEPCRDGSGHWQAYYPKKAEIGGWYSDYLYIGETPLLAAMRSFIFYKFGEEVEIKEIK